MATDIKVDVKEETTTKEKKGGNNIMMNGSVSPKNIAVLLYMRRPKKLQNKSKTKRNERKQTDP